MNKIEKLKLEIAEAERELNKAKNRIAEEASPFFDKRYLDDANNKARKLERLQQQLRDLEESDSKKVK
ncbi:MAG: hypothetical protein R2813_04490 [Flavobacteriales bacterium]